jgi:hypothetical protein
MFNNILLSKNRKLRTESENEMRGMKDGESAKLAVLIGMYMYTHFTVRIESNGMKGRKGKLI